jgi:hypothetical protein
MDVRRFNELGCSIFTEIRSSKVNLSVLSKVNLNYVCTSGRYMYICKYLLPTCKFKVE